MIGKLCGHEYLEQCDNPVAVVVFDLIERHYDFISGSDMQSNTIMNHLILMVRSSSRGGPLEGSPFAAH